MADQPGVTRFVVLCHPGTKSFTRPYAGVAEYDVSRGCYVILQDIGGKREPQWEVRWNNGWKELRLGRHAPD